MTTLRSLYYNNQTETWNIPIGTVARFQGMLLFVSEVEQNLPFGEEPHCRGMLFLDPTDPFEGICSSGKCPLKELIFVMTKEDFEYLGHAFFIIGTGGDMVGYNFNRKLPRRFLQKNAFPQLTAQRLL